ncbi:MAG TPA: SusC/RagA family TonB-linked outer membrane protein [Eubacteriaceae bacterium]|nr:SusC/RagA family TonB-linked outer membrane protein [Eubacteriaceae bacterium]
MNTMVKNKMYFKNALASTFIVLSIMLSVVKLSAQDIQVKLNENNEKEIDLGLTSQAPIEISGSVSAIDGEELMKSPVGNLNQALQGRFPGLFTEETSSELSNTNTDFFIRGLSLGRRIAPLVVIDGVMFPYNGIEMLKQNISASTVESITILKDASTQAIYGSQGANGVISIKTKRGEIGTFKINTRIEQSFQEVTTKPTFINSAEYAELRNQAGYNDGLGRNYFFDLDAINHFAVADTSLYPNNNWYQYFMRDFALMQRADLNVSGGNQNIIFYTNLSLMHQGSQFNTEQTKYNPNFDNLRVTFRSNVEAKLNEYLGTYLFLNGSVKRDHLPGQVGSASPVYSSLFQIPPTTYGPVTPEIYGPEAVDPVTGEIIPPEVIVKKGEVITTDKVENPTYGILNRSGFRNHTTTNIYSHFGLDLDLKFLTQGLKATGMVAFQANYVNQLLTTQDYERWMRTGPLHTLEFTKKGANENTPLQYGKAVSSYYHLTYKLGLDYERLFGKHYVTGMVYSFFQNLSRPENVLPWLLPSNRFNSGIEGTYGYDNRYFLKADFGYSASDKYAREHRFIATPAVSAAWIVSNEQFMSNIYWMNKLKVKASYGLTGNDQDNILSRYPYLDDLVYNPGGYIGSLQYNIVEKSIGNPNIEPEIVVKQNYGIEAELFESLDLSIELFKERTENMVITGTSLVPLYQGIPLDIYPAINDGIFENKGYEISAYYKKSVMNDLYFRFGGFLTHVKNKIIKNNETERSEDYYYRKWQEGFPFGQHFAYLVDYSNGNGFFNSEQELNDAGLQYDFVSPRVGDLIYKDLNQDGIINEKDKAPVGSGNIPQFFYGITGDFQFRNFDCSLLLQGVGKWYGLYNGIGVWETSYDGVYGLLHKKAWTVERYEANEDITSPALSTNESANHQNSDYYLYDRSYLRLKNIEIGYTFPLHITKSISAEKLRIFINGQNLITWDNMKSDDFGPEGSYASIPVYRVYNIGVSLDF